MEAAPSARDSSNTGRPDCEISTEVGLSRAGAGAASASRRDDPTLPRGGSDAAALCCEPREGVSRDALQEQRDASSCAVDERCASLASRGLRSGEGLTRRELRSGGCRHMRALNLAETRCNEEAMGPERVLASGRVAS